jgi:hypothetical protein
MRAGRARWVAVLALIIAAGIGSRVLHTGFVLFDKYLGDALYAAMFYAIFRILWMALPARDIAVRAMVAMTLIELFQLTMIPAQMSTSANPMVRIGARLLGTEFSWLDLAAYAVGIAALLGLDLVVFERRAIGQAQAR